MKKIHELLDDINIEGENIKINQTDMSKEEKNRILELTLNKSNLYNKKATKKRFIIPLAAAMTLVFSFAVVFAQGGLSNIYYKLFGENIKYVNEMGTVIDESYSSNGITFNVANMLGDEHSFYIIVELIKENKENFKDTDYIEFEELHLDFKSSGGYTWYQVEDVDASDNKATFILAGNTKKKIVGDKLTLYAKDITEYSINEPVNEFDAYDFLLNNNEYINQELIRNLQKAAVSNTDNSLPLEVTNKMNEIYNLTPNYVLPWKYSNIFVEENFHGKYIDNIGFAENKLCIRVTSINEEKNGLGDMYFINKNNPEDLIYNEFMFTEEKDGVNYEYYIFDIKDMEELKKYNFKYDIVNKVSTTEGDWEVTFRADYKNTSETIRLNKEANISGKKYNIKNIKISPIALNIEMKNNLLDTFEEPSHNFSEAVSVVMKDGSTVEVSSGGSSTNFLSSSINLMFKQPIDTIQIDKIKIGDLEIK